MSDSVPGTIFVNDSYFPDLGRKIAPMPGSLTITCSSNFTIHHTTDLERAQDMARHERSCRKES